MAEDPSQEDSSDIPGGALLWARGCKREAMRLGPTTCWVYLLSVSFRIEISTLGRLVGFSSVWAAGKQIRDMC